MMHSLFFQIGQRDGIAGLAMNIRLKHDIVDGIQNYLKPYEKWNTLDYFDKKIKNLDNEKLAHDLGILFVVNLLKRSIRDCENLTERCLFLCNQYHIHYGENIHVDWVIKNFKN